MATYFSMHIIACMTRQALRQLIATLQAAQEIEFIRASASQMAGRLLCEFEAPDQDTLLRVLEEHHIAHEWIIRAELTWQGESTGTTSVPELAESAASTASAAAPDTLMPDSTLEQIEGGGPPSAVAPQEAATTLLAAEQARTLHILRNLKDEAAWELIAIQRQLQPAAVLLMHDAVLAPPPLEGPMLACEADVLARGIVSPLPLLTYDQIIDLVFTCERVVVW